MNSQRMMGATLSGWVALGTVIIFKLLVDGRLSPGLFSKPRILISSSVILTAMSLFLNINAIHAEERLNKLLGTVSLGGLLMALLTLAGG